MTKGLLLTNSSSVSNMLKGTAMHIEKAMINDHLIVTKVS